MQSLPEPRFNQSTPRGQRVAAIPLAALVALLFVLMAPVAVFAAPLVIYDSVPTPFPSSLASLGYQATSTSEFGDLIQFAGTQRMISNVSVVMVDWALASDWPTYPAGGWMHPITLNVYAVDNSGANPAPGALVATRTQTFTVPWRPVADPTCGDPTQFRGSDGVCHYGLAFPITFDFNGTTVPDQIIFSIVFNTQTSGPAPIGSAGPYNLLNVGLTTTGPTTGTLPFPDTAYWNTTVPGNYTDGGVGGVGTFRRDTGWTPYSVAITFDAAQADLAVTKTGPATVTAGTDVAYTIVVTNNGADSAQTVALADVLPASETFVSESQTTGPAFVCTNPAVGTNGTVNCTIATLNSGASASFTLVAHLDSAVAPGTTISNTATVSTSVTDPTPGNNGSTSSAPAHSIAAVPTLSTAGLFLLALALAGAAAFLTRH